MPWKKNGAPPLRRDIIRSSWFLFFMMSSRCLRFLLLVMCTHPFAKEALTLHLPRSEGHERYFDCNLMHRKVLASSHQHLMAGSTELVRELSSWTFSHERLPAHSRTLGWCPQNPGTATTLA